jgi:hypothetical protein
MIRVYFALAQVLGDEDADHGIASFDMHQVPNVGELISLQHEDSATYYPYVIINRSWSMGRRPGEELPQQTATLRVVRAG